MARTAGRILPAIIAAYELRSLILTVLSGRFVPEHGRPGSPGFWVMTAIALAVGALLGQTGRGLAARLSRPRWSARLIARWTVGSGALVTVLVCGRSWHGLAVSGHLFTAGGWSSVVAALPVGLLLAISLQATRRAIRLIVRRWRPRRSPAAARADRTLARGALQARPRAVWLTGGRGSRGPPARAVIAMTAA